MGISDSLVIPRMFLEQVAGRLSCGLQEKKANHVPNGASARRKTAVAAPSPPPPLLA